MRGRGRRNPRNDCGCPDLFPLPRDIRDGAERDAVDIDAWGEHPIHNGRVDPERDRGHSVRGADCGRVVGNDPRGGVPVRVDDLIGV